jgi:vacuolar-type H+-ATPase catalytic subunit A/Vma1
VNDVASGDAQGQIERRRKEMGTDEGTGKYLPFGIEQFFFTYRWQCCNLNGGSAVI